MYSEVANTSENDATNLHASSPSGQLYHMFSANDNGVIKHVLFPVDSCESVTSPTNISGLRDVTKVRVMAAGKSPSQEGTRVVILPATSRTRQRSMICEPIRDFPSSPAMAASERSATWAIMACNWTPPCYVTSGRSVTVLASSRSLLPACRATAVVQRSTQTSAAAAKARRKLSVRPPPKFLKKKPKGTVLATVKQVMEVIRDPPQKCSSVTVPRCSAHPVLCERRVLCPKQTLYKPKVPIVVNGADISPLGSRRLYDRGDVLRGDDMQVRIAHRVAMEMRLGLPSGGALWNTRKVRSIGGGDDCVVTWNEPRSNAGDSQAASLPTKVVGQSTRLRSSTRNDVVPSTVGCVQQEVPKVSAEVRLLWNRRMRRQPIRGACSVSSVIARLVEQRKTRLSEAVISDVRQPVLTGPNKRTLGNMNRPTGSATTVRTGTLPVCGNNGLGASSGGGSTNVRRINRQETAATNSRTTI